MVHSSVFRFRYERLFASYAYTQSRLRDCNTAMDGDISAFVSDYACVRGVNEARLSCSMSMNVGAARGRLARSQVDVSEKYIYMAILRVFNIRASVRGADGGRRLRSMSVGDDIAQRSDVRR